MTQSSNILAALLTGIVFAGIATSSTEAQTVSRGFSRSIGNDYLGLTGYAYGYAKAYKANPWQQISTGRSSTIGTASARGYLRATAKILKSTRELARFDARGDAALRTTGASMRGNYRLALAGKTMISKSFTTSVGFARFSRYVSLFSVDPRISIPIGYFSIALKGNAGVGVTSSGATILRSLPFVGVNLAARAWGQGRAHFAFGVRGFKLTTALTARLATQTLDTNLWVSGTSIRGAVNYSISAVRLKLRIYAKALWASYSKTLLNRSWGSYSLTLFKF